MVRRMAWLVAFCFVALSATLAFQVVWSAILATNLKVSPAIPWSVAVMALLLWMIWRYAGGAWWPASTRQARQRYRRAEPVPGRVFVLAIVAGLLALGALIALWLVIGQLTKVPGNPSADFANYSPVTIVSVVVMAGLVGAVAEEIGLRGYMLTRVEAQVSGWAAVAVVALVAAPGHGLTQGFAVPTLLWYFVADVMLGSLALLTRSILPGIVVHLAGLLVFFSIIWPTDRYRRPASLGQQGRSFWIEVLACVALTALSFLVFRRLASTTSYSPGHPINVAGQISTESGTAG